MVWEKFGVGINKGFLVVLSVLAILAVQISVFFKIDLISIGKVIFGKRGDKKCGEYKNKKLSLRFEVWLI